MSSNSRCEGQGFLQNSTRNGIFFQNMIKNSILCVNFSTVMRNCVYPLIKYCVYFMLPRDILPVVQEKQTWKSAALSLISHRNSSITSSSPSWLLDSSSLCLLRYVECHPQVLFVYFLKTQRSSWTPWPVKSKGMPMWSGPNWNVSGTILMWNLCMFL